MIASWRHRGLRELFLKGISAKVRADQHRKCLRLVDALDKSAVPEDMNVPGWHFHGLQGKPKRYAVAVNGPWRITFGFADGERSTSISNNIIEEIDNDLPRSCIRTSTNASWGNSERRRAARA